MIISDRNRFAFLHIPKCAGTTIRLQLQKYDSCGGMFSGTGVNPDLPHLFLAHLPLQALERHYPAQFAKVCAYESYAIIREPRRRFVSALFQHLIEFRGIKIAEADAGFLRAEAIAILLRLQAADIRDLDLVHFQAQESFVMWSNRKIVGNLYPLERLPLFAGDMRRRHRIELDLGTISNRSGMHHGAFLEFLRSKMRPLHRHIPSAGRTWTRGLLTRAGILRTPDRIVERLLADNTVMASVDDHYGADIALYNALR